MKILTNQLKYWIKNVPEDIDVIANALTSLAYEVEELYPANQIQGVKVAKTIKCEKHPNADRLSYCKVALEDGVEHDVVCGGSNVSTGQIIAWAPPGSKIGNITLESKELRGITSNGMILSITEIGGFDKKYLPKEEVEDIVVINNDVSYKDNVASLLALDGYVIDISILPDRQYATNMQMLAYELAAYLDLEIKKKLPYRAKYDYEEEINLELGSKAKGLASSKIEIGNGATPQWIKSLLEHSGIKVENTLLDVMNYFNIMTGNTSYILDSNDISLNDNKLNDIDILTDKPKIKDGNLIVIASSFKTNPMTIKNIDMNFGLKNARGSTNLFMEDTLNLIVEYGQKFGYIKKASKPRIILDESKKILKFDKERIYSFIGEKIDLEPIFKKLKRLNISIEDDKAIIPSYRSDIEGEQDLVEEILRFYGIDNIKLRKDEDTTKVNDEFHKKEIRDVSDYLLDHGFYEVNTYQLLSEKDSKKYNLWNIKSPAMIRKDFGVEYNTMQTSLIQGLIETYKFNYRKDREDAHGFFEIQNVFHSSDNPHLHVGIIIDDKFDNAKEPTLKLKTIINKLLGSNIEIKNTENDLFNPYNSGEIYKNKIKIGVVGELHPKVLREHKFIRIDKVKIKLFYLEIDLELLK